MSTFSKFPVVHDGVLMLPTVLNPTEAALFNGLSVIEDTNLVHFMKAERFVQLLESKMLHLNRVDSYKDDTEEAMYPEINLLESSNMDTQIEEGFSTRPNRRARYELALATRRMTYVHCWFKGDPNNDYMWYKYGDAGKGICIQGSSNRLRLSILFNHSEYNCNVSECVYCDPSEPIPTGVSWFPAIRKNKQRFDMEKEIRFLIRYDINKMKQGINLDELPTFQKLAVNLNGLIDSIFLGPEMQISEKRSILQSIRESGLIEKVKLLR